MLDRDVSRISIADTPDSATELVEDSEPYRGGYIENGAEDSALLIPELVVADQAARDMSDSGSSLSDATDTSSSAMPITDAVTKAAFLVTNWLVGQGEG
jgi:hypothetical protein